MNPTRFFVKKQIINIKSLKNTAKEQPPVSMTPQADMVAFSPEARKVMEISNVARIQAIHKCAAFLTPKTIEKLEALPLPEFIKETMRMAQKAFKIPLEYVPQIIAEKLEKCDLLYSFNANTIYIKSNLELPNKASLYSMLMHEFTHLRQYMDILRTEGLSDKSIKKHVEYCAQLNIRPFFEKSAKQINEGCEPENLKNDMFYDNLKKYAAATTKAEKEAILKETEELSKKKHTEFYEGFRKAIIRELGVIPANTKEAKACEKLDEEFLYMSRNDIIGHGAEDYACELEAYGASDLCEVVYNQAYNQLTKPAFTL